MANGSQEVYILSVARTPFGKAPTGALQGFRATELASYAITEVLRRANINRADLKKSRVIIDEVILGQVYASGQNPARLAARAARLPWGTSALTVNKICNSSTAAIEIGTGQIWLKEADLIIAGGMESMSQAGERLLPDGLLDAFLLNHPHMGMLADQCARVYKISREDQDRYAFESYKYAHEAQQHGDLARQIAPVEGSDGSIFKQDELIRPPDMQRISQSKPAFSKNGTVTGANCSKLADGAAVVLLGSSEASHRLGLKPLARIAAFATLSHYPEWYTTTPAYAVKKLLEKTGLTLDDVDLFEINEASAVVALYNMRALNLLREKVNIFGGAIAIGHPLGASGARLIMNLAYQLKTVNGQYGIAALCNGGGEAMAVLIENIDAVRASC